MHRGIWFVLLGIALAFVAVSPLFVGPNTVDSRWADPENPTLTEAINSYAENVYELFSFDTRGQAVLYAGMLSLAYAVGLLSPKRLAFSKGE